jgi:predicted nucleic acid-binding protein
MGAGGAGPPVIVVDASALLEVLLATAGGTRVADRLFRPNESLHAPHLIDLEVIQVLRRYCLAGELRPGRALEAIADLDALPMARHPHQLFLPRIWELRHALTAYDAVYVTLAEALDAPLITRDRRLAASHGHRAKIELVL